MLPKRLSSRLKFLTVLWLIVAVASIVLTLVLSWRLEGGAAAINDTGSLRMQTYRLSLLLESGAPESEIAAYIGEFDKTLHDLDTGVPSRPLFLPNDQQVRQDMQRLVRTWRQRIKPQFQAVAAGRSSFQTASIPPFIDIIDTLTRSIEKVNNRYLNRLRMFQFILLALVLVSSMIVVVLLYTWIILPLGRLQKGVNAIHDGKLGVQVPTDELAEFAEVDKGFNQMSSRLHDLYQNLEQEVADKTRDLAAKNYTLETLYAFSDLLSRSQSAAEAAEGFLDKVMDIVPADAGSIRLIDFQRRRMDLIAHRGLPDELQNAEACRRLVESLCRQLGVTVSNFRLGTENRQLAVLQERNLIAQGLHDSIAQTLTFLNLQIQMLEKALEKSQRHTEPKVAEKLRFIKEGVQECYDDVRELLLNFRTKITHNEFNEAVGRLVLRFKQQTQIEAETRWLDDGPVLTSEQQLQFIFILQESLSNIRKHARARRVTVTFHNRDDFKMEIEDDGCGFDTCGLNDFAENGHVGLNIMSERARRIRAVLEIASEAGVGTKISLTLPKEERTLE